MKYLSTRGGSPPLPFSTVNMMGLERDGGLSVPEFIPHIPLPELEKMLRGHHDDIVLDILTKFIDENDIGVRDLKRFVTNAYHLSKWDHADIAPVVKVSENINILELFHGPTAAFKDHAMQLEGQVVPFDLARRGETANIVVATSGDTGSAAVEAFHGARGLNTFVLFPDNGTSGFQRKQMTTSEESNVFPMAFRCTFDPLQGIVKKALSDPFQKECRTIGVNSIAWGRILGQIPYFFDAYRRVAKYIGERVTFVVPTGNMGDIYAGWIARAMGLPIDLVLATNSNHVLVDVFETGVYAPWEKATGTWSPSMDIVKGSNFERLLFQCEACDPAIVAKHMNELEKSRRFTLTKHGFEALRACGIRAAWASEEECIAAMQRTFQQHGYLPDPHTAIGLAVGYKLQLVGPIVYLATASPIKFDDAVRAAKLVPMERPERFVGLEDRPERNVVTMDLDVNAALEYIRSKVN